jgi:hypothetical protein
MTSFVSPSLLVLFVAASGGTAHGATPTPHLEGQVEVDPGTGVMRGDLCLSRLPEQETHSFLLNRGLNIREVRDRGSGKPLEYEGFYEAVNEGDATRYTVEDSVGTRGFCVSYVGAYAVYRVDAGERSVVDWKGQIAFDGRTVRAAEQTVFYPIVIDAATGAALSSVSYELEIACPGCPAIFVNGSAPTAGPQASFSSPLPRPLLLFAGDFPYRSAGGVHFVGATISSADANAIRSGIQTVAEAHATYLGVPYRDEPVYLTFASVSRDHQLGESTWQFVTWPTIAMAGRVPFSELLQEDGGRRVFVPGQGIAHEMAHYYFGTRYVPRGPLRWFLLESTAEFLALEAQRILAGEEAYARAVGAHLEKAVAAEELTPLDEVSEPGEIGGAYRYQLGPLLLIALEGYAGEGVVRNTLADLVRHPPVTEVTYPDLRERFLSAGATAEQLTAFEAECLHRPVASGCLSALSPRR